MIEAYYAALAQCAERYSFMSEEHEINDFVRETFTKGIRQRLPLMKLNRWLGYIQGTLIASNVTDVDTERNWTRPLFRPLDFQETAMQIPSIGRIVHYTLCVDDAEAINRRRAAAKRTLDTHRIADNGSQIHVGNNVKAGDVYPMIITRVWGDGENAMVNGQVFLDGNDLFWATSVAVGTEQRTFQWPEYVKPAG